MVSRVCRYRGSPDPGWKATIKNGLDEDASFIEQLPGAEIMGRTYIIPGAGSVAGGAIAGLIFFGQHERIRSVIRRNYEPAGTLIISPSVIVTSINKSSALGMTVMVKF